MLAEATDRPEDLLPRWGGIRQTDGCRHVGDDLVRASGALQAGRKLGACLLARVAIGDATRGADDLADRPVGDALSVGEAATTQHGHTVSDAADQLVDQARLPDPGSAEEGEQVHCSLSRGALERLPQRGQLALPAYQRRIEVVNPRAATGGYRDQSEGGHRVDLALERQLLDRVGRHRLAHQPFGGRPDQDLPGGRGLLQPCGDIHCIAGHEQLTSVARRPLPPRCSLQSASGGSRAE